ncbi:uncharacterized protein LOC127002591 [Eriocheir sinensis]|uniref:uncharacterized protein LOC127002591 n=1 Tax=Eriocheir sinensis TaxID=95602 RepID=UPI0021C7CD78|nr:uncharacterized protein LOC127002591 [Eriocheir sinensis]
MKRQFKLSGAANKKRKKEEEEKRVQSRDALRKYLQPQQQPVKAATEESEEASVSMPSAQVEDPEGGPSTSSCSTLNDDVPLPLPKDTSQSTPIGTATDECEYSESVTATPIDPADWSPELSDGERIELVVDPKKTCGHNFEILGRHTVGESNQQC